MKWDKYNQLTTKEKEEYNYKYGEEPGWLVVGVFKVLSLMNIMMWLLFVAAMLLFGYYDLVLPNPKAFLIIFKGLVKIGMFSLLAVYFVFFVDLGYLAWRSCKKSKWINSKFKEVRVEVKKK